MCYKLCYYLLPILIVCTSFALVMYINILLSDYNWLRIIIFITVSIIASILSMLVVNYMEYKIREKEYMALEQTDGRYLDV
jgi:CDP-diglyceride synthetase